jgi:hypothetical protein
MARRKWIAGAISRPGALRRKAKGAGKSVSSYCAPILKAGKKTRTYSQCLLARTLRGMSKRR